MRAVVIGGSGQIGGLLLRGLEARGHEALGTYATVPFPGLVPLNARDHQAAAAWLRTQDCDVVFYPAGFTWVDGCERDPDQAYEANLRQPLNLARIAAEKGSRFVYFSTDYVFDGQAGPYAETDRPRPLSVYGHAKLDAEQALERELGPAQLTLRTTWVFGPERQGKNFAYQVLRTLRQGKALICPSDQYSTPSYGPDVASWAIQLVEHGVSGLVHLAGPDFVSRDRFARLLAEGFDLDPSGVLSRSTAELGQTAPRPLRGGLRTPRLHVLLPQPARSLSETIADFRRRIEAEPDWADPFLVAG